MTKGLGGKQEGSSIFPEQVKLTSKGKTELCSTETIAKHARFWLFRKVFYNSARKIDNK